LTNFREPSLECWKSREILIHLILNWYHCDTITVIIEIVGSEAVFGEWCPLNRTGAMLVEQLTLTISIIIERTLGRK
jgi:hypothetical protein